MPHIRPPRPSALAGVLLLLASCGGGGGGGEAATPAALNGTLAITASNAKAVAADALANTTDLAAARSAGTLVLSGQVSPVASAVAPALRVAQAATRLASRGSSAGVLAGAVNRSLQCGQGGTMTISGNIADPNGSLAPGDSVTVTTERCGELIDNALATMSGTVSLAVVEGSYSEFAPFPRHVVMSLRATAFSVTTGPNTVTLDGDVKVDLSENSAAVSNVVLSGAALATQLQGPAGGRSATLRNYRQALARSGTSATYTAEADVESKNPRLGSGTLGYHVSTITPLAATNTGNFSAGVLRVDGSGSALLVTVTALDAFRLQADTNGDGSPEEDGTATLAELRALL